MKARAADSPYRTKFRRSAMPRAGGTGPIAAAVPVVPPGRPGPWAQRRWQAQECPSGHICEPVRSWPGWSWLRSPVLPGGQPVRDGLAVCPARCGGPRLPTPLAAPPWGWPRQLRARQSSVGSAPGGWPGCQRAAGCVAHPALGTRAWGAGRGGHRSSACRLSMPHSPQPVRPARLRRCSFKRAKWRAAISRWTAQLGCAVASVCTSMLMSRQSSGASITPSLRAKPSAKASKSCGVAIMTACDRPLNTSAIGVSAASCTEVAAGVAAGLVSSVWVPRCQRVAAWGHTAVRAGSEVGDDGGAKERNICAPYQRVCADAVPLRQAPGVSSQHPFSTPRQEVPSWT